MFAAGFATFALLYVVQPLLPLVGRRFSLSPATSSLTLAVSTAGLAVAVLPLARLSERYGRARVLHFSLALAAALGLAAAFAPSFAILLLIRALQGAALGGVPAAALAWVAEEIHPGAVARAGGLYIAGTTVGGMTGRLLGGALADIWGWRGAVFGVGLLAVAAAVASIGLIPIAAAGPAREPIVRSGDEGPRIRLYLIGGLGMAAFVGIYNVLSYRLEAAPYRLSPSVSGLVFLAYLAGTLTSAQAGRVRDRLGLAGSVGAAIAVALAGLALTLAAPLPIVVVGITLLTGGFFLLHTVASSTVSARAARPSAAAAGYLLVYYLGSSVGGPLLGVAWTAGGWTLAAGAAAALLVAAGLLSLRMD
ncbi:MAG: transporter [Pseudonocardiales bacterium]|nr:transporter [Pseudonocardiales bacterium]